MSKQYEVGTLYASVALYVQDSNVSDGVISITKFMPNKHKLKYVVSYSLLCVSHDAVNNIYSFEMLNANERCKKYKLLPRFEDKENEYPYNVFIPDNEDNTTSPGIVIDLEDYIKSLKENISVISQWSEQDAEPFIQHHNELVLMIKKEVSEKIEFFSGKRKL